MGTLHPEHEQLLPWLWHRLQARAWDLPQPCWTDESLLSNPFFPKMLVTAAELQILSNPSWKNKEERRKCKSEYKEEQREEKSGNQFCDDTHSFIIDC